MRKISLYFWGLVLRVWGLGLGFWGVVGGLYVHTLVKDLLIKSLMMLFLVAKGCKFDSCGCNLIQEFPELLSQNRIFYNRPDLEFPNNAL